MVDKVYFSVIKRKTFIMYKKLSKKLRDMSKVKVIMKTSD